MLSRSEQDVLSAIRTQGPLTRNALAASVGLSLAMTTRIATRLQETGLVAEAGYAESAGPGRQATLLEVSPTAAWVVGVDIGTQMVHLVVSDLHGVPVLFRETSGEALREMTQPQIVTALAELVREAVQEAGRSLQEIAAVGLAVTGVVDSDRGVCLIRSNTPGWEDFPVASLLAAQLSLPVVLEETARAKSLAELQVGAARGAQHFLYVDAGVAVGASIVINRQPFRGISGLAGELGHVSVDPAGPVCRCGNRGCVQATVSAHALVRRAREAVASGVYSTLRTSGAQITLRELAAAADAGDKLALSLLNEAGERLGEAISMALNILGLDLVVMGGGLTACSPVVLEAAARTVRLRVLPIVPRRRLLVAAHLSSDGGARGAVLQAITWLFESSLDWLLARAGSPGNGRVAVR